MSSQDRQTSRDSTGSLNGKRGVIIGSDGDKHNLSHEVDIEELVDLNERRKKKCSKDDWFLQEGLI